MAYNYEYPYTDPSRANSDWILSEMKRVLSEWASTLKEWTGTKDDFDALRAYVRDYFKNLDVREEIDEKLDSMVDDGTLAAIIDQQILGSVQFNQAWVADEDSAAFTQDMLACAASYLVNSMGSDSVDGVPTGRTRPFIVRYNDGNTYMGLLGQGKFSGDKKEIYMGVQYPVMDLDCASFVSLLTKCRDYKNSPYYTAFGSNPSQNDMVSRCYEMGNYMQKPYTIDFLQNNVTYYEAFLLQHSGCPLHKLSTYVGGTLTVNDVAFRELRTGDILFFGSASRTSVYKGIHHCALYVKTLEELNIYGQPYGVSFQAVNAMVSGRGEDNETYGYIIDVGGVNPGGNNVLKVSTLYSRMLYTTNETSYFVHPVSSVLNSTKALNVSLGISPSYKDLYLMDKRSGRFGWIWNGVKLSVPEIQAFNVGAKGTRLEENANIDALANGTYYCESGTLAATMNNPPFDNKPFGLFQTNKNENGNYGVQIAWTYGSENTYKVRHSNVSAEWTEWRTL